MQTKENADKDVKESKKLPGIEKKNLGPGSKRETLGELLRGWNGQTGRNALG